MNLDLTEKKVFISGSSRGLGFFIAKQLLKEGCYVAINGKNKSRLEAGFKLLNNEYKNKVIKIQGDMSIPSQASRAVKNVIKVFGSLDILVCNAGSGISVPPGFETYNEWQKSFSTNLWSATNLIEEAKDYLILSKGNILCISSICGIEVIPGAPVTYSVAKSALNAYVKGISKPLGKKGVRINAIAPGNLFFEGSTWEKKIKLDKHKVMKMLKDEVPLSRFGSPEEIANWAAWIVSNKSSFSTGVIYRIDGGQLRS
jgi:3-oxoacyl-[acyl-carrier protein] reductase